MQYTDPNLLSALAEGSVDFAYGVSPIVFLSLVVLIVVGVWFGYRKTTRQLSSPWFGYQDAPPIDVFLESVFRCLARQCAHNPVVLPAASGDHDTSGCASGNVPGCAYR